MSLPLSAYLSNTPTRPTHVQQVPKVDAQTLQPAQWPTNPNLEWCPPGHGDLYAALAGSGTLDQLLADGVKVRVGQFMHACRVDGACVSSWDG